MRLTSTAFTEGRMIPSKYTCDGENLIPPLAFEDVPSSAATLALIMDDPDAPGGTFDHWLVWNMPVTLRSITEGQPPSGVAGQNSTRRKGWTGPCPPDRQHRYFFTLFALDGRIDLPEGSGRSDLERAMKDHILEKARLMGVYDRVSRRSP